MKKFLLITLASAVVFCFLSVSRAAVPGDEHWDPQFNWPGTTNTIFGIAVNNGKIYAGGNVASGFTTNAALEMWDGLQWTKLGLFAGSTPPILDMAFVGSTLYVAGTFTTIDGAPIRNLAKWDGSSWSSVGKAAR